MQQLEKGADLEQRIEAFFRLHGYDTSRNVFREGKSGARHEIDVLAVKSDDVTDFSVFVECKAWSSPIAKETVSKTHFVMTDLGMNKGIIVSLRGWSTGAELSATQLGIELWGTEEIQNKLGQVAVAQLEIRPSTRTAQGFQIAVMEPQAAPKLIGKSRGLLGFGSEEVTWLKLLWLPFFLVEMDHLRSRSTFLKGNVLETTTRWNLYEALSGRFFVSFEAPPDLNEVDLGLTVPARWQPRKMQREVAEAIKRARSVVTQRAQARHSQRLVDLGVPIDTDATTVTRTTDVYIPAFVALLRTRDRQRLLAVDAVWGNQWPVLDSALTERVAYVEEALALDLPGTPVLPAESPNWLAAAIIIGILVAGVYAAVGRDPQITVLALVGIGVLAVAIIRKR